MRKLGRTHTVGRVSIAVPEEILVAAPKHPELVGLPKGSSRAKIMERLLARGWRSFLQEDAERAQLELYRAYERDPERRAVARADQEELLRSRVI